VAEVHENVDPEDAGQPMTREQALAMQDAHAIGDVPADFGPHCG
jgi:hypothetical protein